MVGAYSFGITLGLLVAFIWALSLIFGYKLTSLLRTINGVIKLEVADVVGRISLVGILLAVILVVLIWFTSEGLDLVRAFLLPEVEQRSMSASGMLVALFPFFIGNLIVLAYLRRPR